MRANKHKKRIWILKTMYVEHEWNCSAIVYGPEDAIRIIGYNLDKALKAFRLFQKRGAEYGKPKNPVWQIKNRLNYGRY
jgi:hypothetical protein